ncbi:hypothetical protein R54767_05264 [Paraburkholderia gardini]|uniref:Uncharacterized protein n=1 Tax=Paraburkholderia gardini TaxID=2823469 RepID=A0ABN7QU89_9BURK|nr:hypothetical protein R54767_05264 [Paraburkholderia gardini]
MPAALVGRARVRFTLRRRVLYMSQSGSPTAVESYLHVWVPMPALWFDDFDQAHVTEVVFLADVATERRHLTLPDKPGLKNSAWHLRMPGAKGVGRSVAVVTCRLRRPDRRTG